MPAGVLFVTFAQVPGLTSYCHWYVKELAGAPQLKLRDAVDSPPTQMDALVSAAVAVGAVLRKVIVIVGEKSLQPIPSVALYLKV